MTKTNVHQGYAIWSTTYDAQTNPTRDLSAAVVRYLAPPLDGSTVIEAGCGTGLNTTYLANHCETLIAFDFSENMLAIAQQKIEKPNVSFHIHDIMQPWPIEPNSADFTTINLVLEHIEHLKPVLTHAHTCLKVGGRLLITEYHPDRVKDGKGAEITTDGDNIIELANFYHPISEYQQLSAEIGFAILGIDTWKETLDASGQPVPIQENPLLWSVVLKKL